jgi:hypothetical protein
LIGAAVVVAMPARPRPDATSEINISARIICSFQILHFLHFTFSLPHASGQYVGLIKFQPRRIFKLTMQLATVCGGPVLVTFIGRPRKHASMDRGRQSFPPR